MSLESFLLSYAKKVDTLDRITGPLAASLYLTGTEWGTKTASTINMLELAFIKIPYIATYLYHTQDYGLLKYVLAKEVATKFVPEISYSDILPWYGNRAKSYLANKNL